MKYIALGICLLLACGTALARGDAEKGKELAMVVDGKDPNTKNGRGCAQCHGLDGNKPSEAVNPVLAGQYPDYIVKALRDYKSGKRKNAIMTGFASGLTAQDMEDLAAWFSSQKSALHDQR